MKIFSGELKTEGNKINGYLVRFGTVDLDGDEFTKDTDFDLENNTKQISLYYNHGQDKVVGKSKIGSGTVTKGEIGIWLEGQLTLRTRYEKSILELAKRGKLGLSSGTAEHLVEFKSTKTGKRFIKWPLGLDASLTPTPAEYQNIATVKGKIMEDTIEEIVDETEVENEDLDIRISNNATIKNMSEMMTKMMERLEQLPTKSKAGFVSETGSTSDKTVKSFGDFCLAVYRNDTDRITKVYKSKKDMSGTSGNLGGFLVPHEYASELLNVSATVSPIYSRVTQQPVMRESGTYPALDQYVAPTAGVGNTAFAGGVVATAAEAGTTLTETNPNFTSLQWRVKKVGGFVEVENELNNDSAFAIDILLRNLFVIAIQAKNEFMILRGSGAGEGLGILNSACAIPITPATNNVFAYADALNMLARFRPIPGDSPVWIIHPSIIPDIGVFETTAGGGVFQANISSALGQNLLGYPFITSEHMPQSNSTAVILASLKAYVMFINQQLSIAVSEHVAFTSDKTVWRFTQRLDGMPWLKSAITYADPTGSFTVSPFVYHND